MKSLFLSVLLGLSATFAIAQDWKDIPVAANAGTGKVWELQTNVSDDFNYTFDASNDKTNFGPNDMWYNFYHNHWDGPGTTYWKYNHVSVEGGDLILKSSRFDKNNQPNPQYPYANGLPAYKMNKTEGGVNAGCITSNQKVVYPVYVETSLSVANIALASCFWLLSPDDTQEIDIIENYGDVDYFKQFTHISHHSFIRNPFHDYQPRDRNSWWPDSRVNTNYGWGDWCWNDGDRRYFRLAVNWISPNHFEYYIDGKLVRVLYENAIATDIHGTWEYTYYNDIHPEGAKDEFGSNIGGMPTSTNGYSDITIHARESSYSFETLKATSEASNGINVIDPGNYQNGTGFTKELDIIVNIESQSWLVSSGQTPSDDDLSDPNKQELRVNWIRAYKPVAATITEIGFSESDVELNVGESYTLSPQISPTELSGIGVDYISNDPTIATVDQNGKVTGLAEGEAVITASVGDIKATINVRVTKTITDSDELGSSKIKLSPNPASGEVNILGLPLREFELRLIDIHGKTYIRQHLKNQSSYQLHLGEIPSGVYFIHLKSGKFSTVRKLIVS
ncbi:T9SS type A sorting domain-containing protein [Sediminitomix flava]|uniref:Putative secreted protein (Por secretion system target) n=1 Tax=Sediminitomix flava TaxID=379075 RepID=A0A315Z6Q8_SEDFL|nr:T9SS type A sorting domain-containing protein [Sediminitomix flava]PWJ37957.1 putative secreted protein (Por secretion system target) [Sediminitomix flava]